ncbi:MAG: hypothetical protein ACRDF0_03730, partial [Candidatus Limnocylindria bacterium]
AARVAAAAREVAWTAGGLFVLAVDGERAGDAIVRLDGASARRIVDRERLLADPRARQGAAGTSMPRLSTIGASFDGRYLSARLTTPAGAFILVLIRASDGAPTGFVTGASIADIAWSPARALVGHTSTDTGGQPARPRAEVRDPANNAVVAQQDGRFAGWSPDGAHYYVARAEGLFAFPLAGGAPLRISPIGVPVSTTLP